MRPLAADCVTVGYFSFFVYEKEGTTVGLLPKTSSNGDSHQLGYYGRDWI